LQAAAPTSSPSPPRTASCQRRTTAQGWCASFRWQQQNAEAQLAEDDGVDRDFTFVVPQPFDHFGIGHPIAAATRNIW